MATVDYPDAKDMIITDPAWVFTDALQGLHRDLLTIVIHKTACNGPCTAENVASNFANDTVNHKSAHFVVGLDGEVVQVVLLKDGAGANCCFQPGYDPYWNFPKANLGNMNECTISIEHVDQTVDNSQAMPDAQVQSSFKLVKFLCDKYGIGFSQIKTHASMRPIDRARCPGPTYPFPELEKFLEGGPVSTTGKSTQFDKVWSIGAGNYVSGIAKIVKDGYMLGKYSVCHQLTAEEPMQDWDGNDIVYQTLSNGLYVQYAGGHGKVFNMFGSVVYEGDLPS